MVRVLAWGECRWLAAASLCRTENQLLHTDAGEFSRIVPTRILAEGRHGIAAYHGATQVYYRGSGAASKWSHCVARNNQNTRTNDATEGTRNRRKPTHHGNGTNERFAGPSAIRRSESVL
jgi:hypothetical protein